MDLIARIRKKTNNINSPNDFTEKIYDEELEGMNEEFSEFLRLKQHAVFSKRPRLSLIGSFPVLLLPRLK